MCTSNALGSGSTMQYQLWPSKELGVSKAPVWNQKTGTLAVDDQRTGARLGSGTELALEPCRYDHQQCNIRIHPKLFLENHLTDLGKPPKR